MVNVTRAALVSLIVLFGSLLFAEPTVRYTLDLANPAQHLVHVTVEIPPGKSTHQLQLPVWNALYQIRDFSQYMRSIRAEDASGQPIAITEINPSRWEITGADKGAKIEYEMYSDNSGSFGAQLNPQHAFFNLAEILIYADDERNDPDEIKFTNVPPDWRIATALARSGDVYAARNYDQLVDSPVEIGTFVESDFQGKCGEYRVVVDPATAKDALDKIIPSIQRIVNEATEWMGDCPFKTYTFIFHFNDSPGRGGMEHAYSTAITMPLAVLNQNLGIFDSITAHEFFHLWNVKRIRPQSLEPIDYTKENYTTALWFSEGVDSTAGGYIRLRAGLLDEQHYLSSLGQAITELEDAPAHLTQSVEQSSLDAWLEKYPAYSLPERSISYYNKGELLGTLLDLRMREASRDRATLQSLFRWMNEHYAKQGRFFADSVGVREAAEKLSGADLRGFFADYVSGVREIPWNDFFGYVGLQVTSSEVSVADPGFEAVQNFDHQPVVVGVDPGSNAERASLRPGDIIEKVNGQAAGREFRKEIDSVAPGGVLVLVVQRGGVSYDLQFTVGSRKRTVYQLQDVANLTTEQKRRRELWLFDGATPTQ